MWLERPTESGLFWWIRLKKTKEVICCVKIIALEEKECSGIEVSIDSNKNMGYINVIKYIHYEFNLALFPPKY